MQKYINDSLPTNNWLKLILPLLLTIMLAIICYLFYYIVNLNYQEALQTKQHEQEIAVLESKDLLDKVNSLVDSYYLERTEEIILRDNRLTSEAREIIEAVYRLLSASFDKPKVTAITNQLMRNFPMGFEELKSFLEVMNHEEEQDQTLETLQANIPELSELLPVGCKLIIIEDYSKELLSLGNNLDDEETIKTTVSKDLIFKDNNHYRNWTIQLELAIKDEFPPLTPILVGEKLTKELSTIRFDNLLWRFCIYDKYNDINSCFPKNINNSEVPTLTETSIWVNSGNGIISRAEKLDSRLLHGWYYNIYFSLEDHPLPPLYFEKFTSDIRWGGVIVFFAVLCLISWLRYFWQLKQLNNNIEKRIVKRINSKRSVSEAADLIIADFDKQGKLAVTEINTLIIPSGSLNRLQTLHRGGENIKGSKILDQAKSQLLRELAKKVRTIETTSKEKVVRRSGKNYV